MSKYSLIFFFKTLGAEFDNLSIGSFTETSPLYFTRRIWCKIEVPLDTKMILCFFLIQGVCRRNIFTRMNNLWTKNGCQYRLPGYWRVKENSYFLREMQNWKIYRFTALIFCNKIWYSVIKNFTLFLRVNQSKISFNQFQINLENLSPYRDFYFRRYRKNNQNKKHLKLPKFCFFLEFSKPFMRTNLKKQENSGIDHTMLGILYLRY